MSTSLLLTGVTRKEEVDKAKIYPDYIVNDLNTLFVDVKQPC
ncbi:HAD hydrolase-like protein [Staphylococcus epidermidis]